MQRPSSGVRRSILSSKKEQHSTRDLCFIRLW